MAKKNEFQDDEPITFGACRKLSGECKANNKYIIGGLASLFLALSFILYTLYGNVNDKVSEAHAQITGQQRDIEYVRKGVDEIRENQLTLIGNLQRK